jgi:cytochrome c oxidase cbb3-type subunit 1
MQNNATLSYDYSVVKQFMLISIVLGLVGMLVGVILAFQLAFPGLSNLGDEFLTFSRLRPLHTNAVAYGFAVPAIISTCFYILQRTLKVSLAESKFLSVVAQLMVPLYVLILALAVLSFLTGTTTSKEYAELEWPIDLMVVVVWVMFGLVIFGLIGMRREKSLYISTWYFIATFLAVAMLYITNNLEVPTKLVSGYGSIFHSVSLYAGTNDALVEWWFGHNAVGFVLTAPIIGMIYYFLPKEAGQPIYSYKLSLIGFWSFLFVYIWAGGHHLIYSTVPDWMQTMGSVFSVVLILPSWAAAINLLLTMKGQWQQLKDSPLIKFMIFASTFYMFSTIEGPIQSIKSVNALAHFTNWIVGHVHDGALGWVVFMICSAFYHMAPRLFGREIYSKKLMDVQFWVMTTGVVLYFSSMWIAGVTQGLMWRASDDYGSLAYSFIDVVRVLFPYYVIRAVGGALFLVGFAIFCYNMIKTMSAKQLEKEPQFASPMGA